MVVGIGELRELLFALAGIVNVGLALWLLYINFPSRTNQVLALFLVMRGLLNLTTYVADLVGAPATGEGLAPYFQMAVPFTAVYFGLVYWSYHGGDRTRLGARLAYAGAWLLLLAAVAVEVAYFRDHTLYAADLGTADGDPASGFGPLYLFAGLNLPSYAAIALLMARAHGHVENPLQRRSLLLVALGFALNPAFSVASALVQGIYPWTGPGISLAGAFTVWRYAAGVIVAAMVAMLFIRARRSADPELRREVRRGFATLALAAASALLLALPTLPGTTTQLQLNGVLAAIWVLVLPMLLAYSLLKYQLFGLDVKLRFAIKQSTIGAAFVAVFFAVSEIAQELLSNTVLGPYLGIGAAGLLLFAIAPLQRMAERVATAAMPDAKPVGQMSDPERRELYQEQVRVAWADGVMTRKDRQLLEVARASLGLGSTEAAEIERAVLGA